MDTCCDGYTVVHFYMTFYTHILMFYDPTKILLRGLPLVEQAIKQKDNKNYDTWQKKHENDENIDKNKHSQ